MSSETSVHKCHSAQQDHEENHLCRVVVRQDMERVRKIVKGAKFFCKNCGRAANAEENLCKPGKI